MPRVESWFQEGLNIIMWMWVILQSVLTFTRCLLTHFVKVFFWTLSRSSVRNTTKTYFRFYTEQYFHPSSTTISWAELYKKSRHPFLNPPTQNPTTRLPLEILSTQDMNIMVKVQPYCQPSVLTASNLDQLLLLENLLQELLTFTVSYLLQIYTKHVDPAEGTELVHFSVARSKTTFLDAPS